MALNNDTAQREALKRAMRIAEIRVEDAEDMNECVSDLVRSAGLDEDSARIVAAAYREAMMPEALEAEGFDPKAFMNSHDGNEMTADFANDKSADNKDMHDEDHEDDMGTMDDSEADDNVATLEVEVLEKDLGKFQEALEKAMAEVFGDAEEVADDMEDHTSDIKINEEDEDSMSSVTANGKVQNMNRNARAEREAILASLGTRTASDNFEYKAEYTNEGEHATMTMQNSEGNSLRGQNPTFDKVPVPTVNGRLGLEKELDAVTLDGKVDDMNAYKINFDPMAIPSGEGDALPEFGEFEVPTQNPAETSSRKNTITTASDITSEEAAEEELYTNLVQAGVSDNVISNLTFAEGLELFRQITASKIENLARMAQLTIEVDAEDMEEEDEVVGMTDEDKKAEWATFSANAVKEAQIYQARLKTAYGVSTKLCLAGLISSDEVEANVDLWMNDGMSVKAMLASGTQMLRMSQSAEQRVATAHVEKNLRTASAQGVANIPGYTGSTSNVSSDLQQALKSIFTMPRFED